MKRSTQSDEPVPSSAADTKRRRRRKVAIVSAICFVACLFVLSSLAVYSDSIHDGKSGRFSLWPGWLKPGEDWGVQGNYSASQDDAAWGDFDTSSIAGAMEFPLEARRLLPGQTVYAPLSLRVNPDEDRYPANVSLLGATADDPNRFFDALEYRVGRSSPADCAAGNSGTDIPGWPGYGGTHPSIRIGSDPGQPIVLPRDSDSVDLCFAVTLPESFRGIDLSSDVTWQIVAQPDR